MPRAGCIDEHDGVVLAAAEIDGVSRGGGPILPMELDRNLTPELDLQGYTIRRGAADVAITVPLSAPMHVRPHHFRDYLTAESGC
jgi:hypothetical protein